MYVPFEMVEDLFSLEEWEDRFLPPDIKRLYRNKREKEPRDNRI